MSDRRARQLMDAAEVASTIAKSGTTVPKSERQARPLATLPPSQRVEVWQKAVAASPNGQPTAKAVQVVVEAMNPQPPKTVRVVVDNPKPQTPKTVNVVVQKQIGNDPDSDPPSTPLQWLTHWWTRANREERAAFNNCKDLMPLSNP